MNLVNEYDLQTWTEVLGKLNHFTFFFLPSPPPYAMLDFCELTINYSTLVPGVGWGGVAYRVQFFLGGGAGGNSVVPLGKMPYSSNSKTFPTTSV